MLDFEKLHVYQKAKFFYNVIWEEVLKGKTIDKNLADQLKRAGSSISLNIAEGCSRTSKPDRRNFYTISRGSVFECIAILNLLKDTERITDGEFQKFYNSAEELSKMLFGLIKSVK